MTTPVVIVTGSRHWPLTDPQPIYDQLDLFNPTVLVQGRSEVKGEFVGADRIAWDWGVLKGLPPGQNISVPADWTRYGKPAGARRNKQMLVDWPRAVVLAFPHPLGVNIGTNNCINQAICRGMTVFVYDHQYKTMRLCLTTPKTPAKKES